MTNRRLLRYYPIALQLEGKRLIVVGGGAVAQRKVLQLLKADVCPRLITPKATKRLVALAEKGKISWVKRRVAKKDVINSDIVIAATDDRVVNEDISTWAGESNVLVNVVDNTKLSSFISPALLRLQKAIIAVYTDGRDPGLSRDLKNFIKENWDDFLSYRDRL